METPPTSTGFAAFGRTRPPGGVTTIGPLTTTFTPSSYCYTPLLNCNIRGCTVEPYGWRCDSSDTTKLADGCFPDGTGDQWASYNPVFDPGSVCPVGWTSACEASGGWSSTVHCCPSQYSCDNGGYVTDTQCVSVLPLGTTRVTMNRCGMPVSRGEVIEELTYEVYTETRPTWIQTRVTEIITWKSRLPTTVKGTVVEELRVYHDVNIVSGTSTIARMTGATASIQPVRLVLPPSSTTRAAFSTGASRSNSETSPRKAKVLAGVFVPVLAIFIGVAIFLFIRRGRRNATEKEDAKRKEESKKTDGPSGDGTSTGWIKPELDDQTRLYEAAGPDLSEMDGSNGVHEVPAENTPRYIEVHELPGDRSAQIPELEGTCRAHEA